MVAVNRSRVLVVSVFEAVVTIAGRNFGVQQVQPHPAQEFFSSASRLALRLSLGMVPSM
jgi:hypothetical protein